MMRLVRYNLLLSSLKYETVGRIKFFRVRKFFSVQTKIHRRKYHWLTRNPEDVFMVVRKKFRPMLSIVFCEAHVMQPHFYERK